MTSAADEYRSKLRAPEEAVALVPDGSFVFKGNCAIVQRCSKAIAQDIAGWLMHPIDGAELGDAR